MALNSNISWTDHTWNIARGCSKVDEDCKFCYMFRDSFDGTRFNPREVTKTKGVFNLPLRIQEPSKIFTCSLTDFFHEGCDSFRQEAWDIIRQCPQHIFQILTKRPERIIQCLPDFFEEIKHRVWLGTSIGSKKGKQRLYQLPKIEGVIRFVSFEPLYEFLDMGREAMSTLIDIDWAIIGGESGNETGKYRYRECKVEWMEDIAKAVSGAGGSVFVKQMGTYLAKQWNMSDRHGTKIEDFPLSLKLREMPKTGGVLHDEYPKL